LIHHPGHHPAKPDALSRCVDHKKGEEDHQNQTLLPPTLFHISTTITGATLIIGREQEFLSRIRNCTDRDEQVVKALKELGTLHNLRGGEWSEENGLVLYRGKIYIPLDLQLRNDIVKAHHDTPITGHSGR